MTVLLNTLNNPEHPTYKDVDICTRTAHEQGQLIFQCISCRFPQRQQAISEIIKYHVAVGHSFVSVPEYYKTRY